MSQGIRHAPLITFFTPAHAPQKGKARSPYFSCIVYMDFAVHVIRYFSYSLACVNMSKISCANQAQSGEYRGRTDDLLHAMQAL